MGFGKGAAVERGTRGNRHTGDHLVAVTERHAQHRVHLLAFFDEPHHLLRGITELFRGRAEMQEPS